QSAPTAGERDSWLERAARQFPDIQADENLFPPPLLETFRARRAVVLEHAENFEPFAQFRDYRYLLINGKRFAISPDLKIKLPDGEFRISAYSDTVAPVTERLSRTQLKSFRVQFPHLASGTCLTPSGADSIAGINSWSVVYSADCLRT